MISYEIREAILALQQQGRAIREISRALKVSRNTVRRALRQPEPKVPQVHPQQQAMIERLPELYRRCKGNGVRICEVFKDEYDIDIAYSSLTRLLREERKSGV